MSILSKLKAKLDKFLDTRNNLIAVVSVLAAYGLLSIAVDILVVGFYTIRMLVGLL
jgi:hypothetical protein